MASPTQQQSKKKLRILLIPFFATSHIGPFTDLAFHLAAARPDDVEAAVAVTPTNAPIVRSVLARRGRGRGHRATVEVVTYPFPTVDGLPPGVENLSTVAATDAWRINVASADERLMRPGQESLIRHRSPDAVISDVHFVWNVDVAADLGVPCVMFHVIGAFSMPALIGLLDGSSVTEASGGAVTLAWPPGLGIRVPVPELPEILRAPSEQQVRFGAQVNSAHKRCFGLVVNTFFDLEHGHCDMYVRHGYVKRAYFAGPLSLPSPLAAAAGDHDSPCIDWLDKKPAMSVMYLCFGTLTHLREAQLRELALGLEASGKPFLWVIRSETWVPPEGWQERVGERGMVRGRHGMGPTNNDSVTPGGVCHALRVELGLGDRCGWRAGADVANGVRAVHHREVRDGSASNWRAAVAGGRWSEE
ncbi:unnamed protein product [Urochloa humidicola]